MTKSSLFLVDPMDELETSGLACPYCDMTGFSEGGLSEHIEARHEYVRMPTASVCPKCQKVFNSSPDDIEGYLEACDACTGRKDKKPVMSLSRAGAIVDGIGGVCATPAEYDEAVKIVAEVRAFLIDLGVKEGEKFRKEHGREPTEFEAGIIAQTILQQAKVALALSKGVKA